MTARPILRKLQLWVVSLRYIGVREGGVPSCEQDSGAGLAGGTIDRDERAIEKDDPNHVREHHGPKRVEHRLASFPNLEAAVEDTNVCVEASRVETDVIEGRP